MVRRPLLCIGCCLVPEHAYCVLLRAAPSAWSDACKEPRMLLPFTCHSHGYRWYCHSCLRTKTWGSSGSQYFLLAGTSGPALGSSQCSHGWWLQMGQEASPEARHIQRAPVGFPEVAAWTSLHGHCLGTDNTTKIPVFAQILWRCCAPKGH